MSKVSDTVEEKIKTHVLYSLTFFAHVRAICEILWKNMVEPDKPRVVCWVTKATDKHLKYVIFITFVGKQLIREQASM